MSASTILRNILIFQLSFLSLGALAGGGMLIISPEGALLGMPLSVMGNAPFKDFLIPGIILFMVFGVCPALLLYPLLRKPVSDIADKLNIYSDMHWSWTYSIYTAFALITWIQAEMMFLGHVFALHTFYMCYAVIMIFVLLLPQLRNRYKVIR